MVFVSLITGLMVAESIKILTHISNPIATNKSQEIHFKDMQITVAETWNKLHHCPVCSK